MNIAELYRLFLSSESISTDSRKIKRGDIFWALKGENFNGNLFAQKAIDNGASYAIVDDEKLIGIDKFIYVNDTLKALQDLATYHRKKLKIPIIAITGTNGKTTTKELTYSVLNKKFKVKATSGNYNNHIGVPLTLLSMDKSVEIGVVEMGANHQGEIKTLCKIALPDYGLITNIGKAHLEGFGSFEVLIKTKTELYDHLENSGQIFINEDNELLTKLIKVHKTSSYGTKDNYFCQGNLLSADPFLNLSVNLKKNYSVQTKLVGSYNFENVLAAICVGKYFKVEDELIISAIEEYIPDNNRSQIIEKGKSKIILDAYNANPTSLEHAVKNIKNITSENKVLFIGDMFELGEFSANEHLKICNLLKELKKSEKKIKVFLIGSEFYKINLKTGHSEYFTIFETTDQLIENLKNFHFSNAWILIKGSRGMKLERILEHLIIET